MISNLDGASELFLANLNRIQGQIADANRLVSSGKKIATASDAPDQIEPLLQLRAESRKNAQIQSNLTLAGADAASADSAIAGAIKLMDRARVLAAQGASSTLDASGRQSLADEVQALLEEMVSYSQTAVQGRYIFSGDLDSVASYQVDAAAPTGVTQANTSDATRRIENPAGGSFAASLTAQSIFDTRNGDGTVAADNVFAALHSLRSALLANDPAAVTQTIGSLQSASDRLNSSEAFYGVVQRRISQARSYAESYSIQLKTQSGEMEDADIAAAATQLTQSNTQLQAALQMRAKLPNHTLFDYLG
jgi:flagellar hook-associated protein 3 FlgL